MEEMPSDSLASRVQQRMAALDLNPFSTAKLAGLKSGYVHDILRGKVLTPGADKLDSLAVALETSTTFLLGKGELPADVFDEEGRRVQEAMKPSQGQSTQPTPAVLLPIRYELAADVWRTATEVSAQPLGFHAASIPHSLIGRDHWYEYVRDDSFSAMFPRGSLVHVCEISTEEINLLGEGDVVVVVKRLYSSDPPIHLVERSLRRISSEMSGWGMLFFSLATGDPDNDWTDEVFREDLPRQGPTPKLNYTPPTKPHSPEMETALGRLDLMLSSKKHLEEFIAENAARKPRVTGRVIRAILPVSGLGNFGLTP